MKFRELVPETCPTQLSDLVIDCCNYYPHNRPDFERVVHRLVDIRNMLPYFTGGSSISSYEEFEEALIPYNESSYRETHDRVKAEEIKIKEYFVDEAANVISYEALEFEEIVLEELQMEDIEELDHHNLDEIDYRDIEEVEVDGVINLASSSAIEISPIFHSASPTKYHSRENLNDPQDDSLDENIYESVDDGNFIEMEELTLKVLVPPDNALEYGIDLVHRNEKYSYYYE